MNSKNTNKNKARVTKDGEFLDANHDAMDAYYELMNKNFSSAKVKEVLEQLIIIDPDFYDPYTELAHFHQENGEYETASKILYQGYQRAIKRITDKEDIFPKSLPWLWLENRHIIRVINAWGYELWEQGKPQETLEIFRKLLRSNPNDNLGIRLSILAIRLGLKSDFYDKFTSKDMPEYMDANKVDNWFEENSKKFPDEFGWWWKVMEERKKGEE